MNREQMIEKGARVLSVVPEDMPIMRDEAEAVLDAILPQVTTVEELEALPGPALLLGALVGRFPAVFRWTNGQLYYEDAQRVRNLDPTFGPLTVVWSPS